MAARPARLCIISREPLRSGHFIAALQTSLDPQDDLQIINDRRRGGPGAPDRKEDRRRQPRVTLALEANGFAIVPAPFDRAQATALPSLPSASIERFPSVGEEDEQRLLESIRNFQRHRPVRLVRKRVAVLGGGALVALALLLAAELPWQDRPGKPDRPPDQPRESSTVVQSPALVEEPVAAEPPVPVSGAPARKTGAAPQPAPLDSAPDGRPGADTAARPSPSAPPAPPQSDPAAAAPPPRPATKAASAPVVRSHRAELVGAPEHRGWGNSYAVRLLDAAGRPMVQSNVLLVARMADGTVESIAMGALAEPGTYRGTVPTSRSTPVDLRVRVATGGGVIEVPVRP